VKRALVAVGILLLGVAVVLAQQKNIDDEGGRVLAFENAWNHALEAKDAKALDMILANTFVSIDIDGSVSSKGEFLASIKAPDYQPSQAVTEQSNVQVYGNAAVVVGTFRVKGTEKGKPYVHRTLRGHLDQAQRHLAMRGHHRHADHREARSELNPFSNPTKPFRSPAFRPCALPRVEARLAPPAPAFVGAAFRSGRLSVS